MKLIGADTVYEIIDRERLFGNGDCGKVRKLIEDLPEAVVRCRNCKYADYRRDEYGEFYVCECDLYETFLLKEADMFCSFGERKTNETD